MEKNTKLILIVLAIVAVLVGCIFGVKGAIEKAILNKQIEEIKIIQQQEKSASINNANINNRIDDELKKKIDDFIESGEDSSIIESNGEKYEITKSENDSIKLVPYGEEPIEFDEEIVEPKFSSNFKIDDIQIDYEELNEYVIPNDSQEDKEIDLTNVLR